MSVFGSSFESARHWTSLLPQEALAGTLQVPVGLVRPERLRVEDDEPRVDATPAQRLHVRPADPGQVHRAVRDPERQLVSRRWGRGTPRLFQRAISQPLPFVEVRVDRLALVRPGHVRDLRAAEDLRAGLILRNRGERVVHDRGFAQARSGSGACRRRGTRASRSSWAPPSRRSRPNLELRVPALTGGAVTVPLPLRSELLLMQPVTARATSAKIATRTLRLRSPGAAAHIRPAGTASGRRGPRSRPACDTPPRSRSR